MKIISRFLLVIVALGMMPQSAMAQTFTCAVSKGIPYCEYKGKVRQAYMNDDNLVLMYFEEYIDLSVVSAAGYSGVSGTYAAAYLHTENPAFAEALYSTILTALAADKEVAIQMRGSQGGLLKIDRFWIQQ
ncbi:hypothetical protein [Parasphingorhabdus litoris]|nr:hypothetical protein [Parasphingorhabdus litoris]